jgi:hypothetical protein
MTNATSDAWICERCARGDHSAHSLEWDGRMAECPNALWMRHRQVAECHCPIGQPDPRPELKVIS